MQLTKLSLRGLEIFQLVAKSGSARKVAADTGLSISTVSHHLRRLEDDLGVSLLDHTRRPMVLTPVGTIFLRYIDGGLRLIRRGEIELASGNLIEAQNLRLGIVEDFESEVAPELMQFLMRAMPKCIFKYYTRPSHEILELLQKQHLDVGVATRPPHDVPGLIEYPLLRDPFVLAVPKSNKISAEELLQDGSGLPFLRYSREQIIGNLIETHLRRSKVTLENRFELESNHSIMGMVAEEIGWTITTPSHFVRTKRFHDRITLLPLPMKNFVRTISLFTTDYYPQELATTIAESIRRLFSRQVVEQVTTSTPWLLHDFQLLTDADEQS
ncbi:LysR family transcriptional regulator [Aliiroseovarius sp. F20344]|uniref:LysR family transcriptional regulator n=1 Tax=Aliiroseovarius sp. F20344 TaxID=2926414 RepID=UPI001FF52B5F|nr:LysR family transcriptional regulator [Aliiroseovarius sp. F20344]MCK0142824.1 LysR family transcriptional regulator [Aliiroseovarius sp. F20344]